MRGGELSPNTLQLWIFVIFLEPSLIYFTVCILCFPFCIQSSFAFSNMQSRIDSRLLWMIFYTTTDSELESSVNTQSLITAASIPFSNFKIYQDQMHFNCTIRHCCSGSRISIGDKNKTRKEAEIDLLIKHTIFFCVNSPS